VDASFPLDKAIEICLTVIGAAWGVGTTFYLYRNRIPKVRVDIAAKHCDVGNSSVLYVTVTVENLDRIKVDADSCSLNVRLCFGTDVVPDSVAVQPVPPAIGRLDNAGAGVWKPSSDDRERIWTIDRGEKNTFTFVATVPWLPERPSACLLQADYRCKPWKLLGIKMYDAYTWRRDELYTFDEPASGRRLPEHQGGTNDRENDPNKLAKGESFAEDEEAEENGRD